MHKSTNKTKNTATTAAFSTKSAETKVTIRAAPMTQSQETAPKQSEGTRTVASSTESSETSLRLTVF